MHERPTAGVDLACRRARARRQGNPAWLWPDVEPDAWRAANRTIAAIIGTVLCGEGRPQLLGDPDAIGLAGYISGMGPMLGFWLETGAIGTPEPAIADRCAAHLGHNRHRMALLLDQAERLTGELSRAGAVPVVLKGGHTATAYFPEPGVRPMSDIDLLVAPGDLPAASNVLSAAGFACELRLKLESCWRQRGGRRSPASLLMLEADDPWSIDLHHSLDVAVSAAAPPAALDRASPMDRTQAWRSSSPARTLRQPLLLLHLAVHAGSGLHNLSLLRLLELALVIRRDRAEGKLDWREFVGLAELTGSCGYAYPALDLCERLAPGHVPDYVLAACAAAAPSRAVRVVERLTPASAQRVDSHALREHFMWARGPLGWLRQIAADLLPGPASFASVLDIYTSRCWRLLRGRYSR